MKNNFWKFLVHLLHDDRGSVSLTGEDTGDSSTDGAGDSGLPDGSDAGEPTSLVEDSDNTSGVGDGSSLLSDLEEEIKSDPSLKVFMDDKGNVNIANLAKSYVNTKRKMGEKGIVLPTDKSSEEDWAAYFNMVRPPELDKYEVVNKAETGVALDDELFKGYREVAHKTGLSQKQAQGLLDWFNSSSAGNLEQMNQSKQEAYTKEVENLKADWGDSFDSQLNVAKRALKEFADESTLNYLKETGLDKDVTLIRVFNKIGQGLLEDKFISESHGNFGATKEQAQQKMNQIYGDPAHAYWHKDHASHKDAVNEMNKLMEVSLR